jgi:hypothetical protein
MVSSRTYQKFSSNDRATKSIFEFKTRNPNGRATLSDFKGWDLQVRPTMEPCTADDGVAQRRARRELLAQKIAGIAVIYAIEKVFKTSSGKFPLRTVIPPTPIKY